MNEEYINKCGKQIESFISISFDNVKVEYVEPEEVTARTTIGFDAQEELERSDASEVYYRIQINNVNRDNVFERSGTLIQYFTKLIQDKMERNSPAPDTIVIEADIPPQSVFNKPFVFYVRSVI